jgi:DNA-directed RNA polymerase specialized sigma24 family protein
MELLLGQILNPHERMLFDMYYLQGYSAAEMAEMEETNETNIRVRMFRLRKRIVDCIGVV